ncbi:MAG: OsmC family protein [Deltaproteobacteria bacterium]|nr:OsmC family protein [Kofleriaceae bacterium]
MNRTAQAVWRGSGPEGSGHLTTQSRALSELPYSAKLRFQNEDGTLGTNPEELIAAAHAGCFSMALAFRLTAAGSPAESIETDARLELVKGDAGWHIPAIHLTAKAKVPGIDEAKFQELAADAKANCPVSQVLAGASITLTATLLV